MKAIQDNNRVQVKNREGPARTDRPFFKCPPRAPRCSEQRSAVFLQDLDLDTASPMSPASPATPRAMPPTIAMPTSPSGESKRKAVRNSVQPPRDPDHGLPQALLQHRREESGDGTPRVADRRLKEGVEKLFRGGVQRALA